MNPVDLLIASSWTRVAFTTYALSLSFFEAVILDALVRGRACEALILSDPEGIRSALSEEGARRVGRDYEIAPVVRRGPGIFHPKVSVLAQKDDAHLLIGSGNLTFSGWGGNLEVIEHLHPSFAAEAFDDAVVFFEALASSDHVATSAGEASYKIAEDLRKTATGGLRDGSYRLLHSLDSPIAEQIALYADDLGGATRIAIASPYFDLDGRGLSRLATEMGCDNIQLHSHPAGSVWGSSASAWPFDAIEDWKAISVQHMAGDERRLHGKAIEIVCRRGRLLLSGSANATEAGLFGGNVEASVLRVQRLAKSYWQTSPSVRPTPWPVEDSEVDIVEANGVGILAAKLDGDVIVGRVLTNVTAGKTEAHVQDPQGTEEIGEAHVDENGHFRIKVSGVEFESVRTGRLILRLIQGPKVWEGFLSVTVALELVRRAGPMAAKLMAVLTSTDTPADVAAILAWFNEDPKRLPNTTTKGFGGQSTEDASPSATFISACDLRPEAATASNSREIQDLGPTLAWQRAMDLLRASFAQNRGPWPNGDVTDEDSEEVDTAARSKQILRDNKSKEKSLKYFNELLEKMLDPAFEGRNAPVALSLAHFLTARIQPEPSAVQSWMRSILNQIVAVEGPEADMILASALLYHDHSHRGSGEKAARRYLLKLGLTPDSLTVDPSCISAFIDVLNPKIDLIAELSKVRNAKTMGEQLRDYIAAVTACGPKNGFDSLKASKYWPQLQSAIDDPAHFSKFTILEAPTDLCPRKHILLPATARHELRTEGVTCCDCCAHIILNRDC